MKYNKDLAHLKRFIEKDQNYDFHFILNVEFDDIRV